MEMQERAEMNEVTFKAKAQREMEAIRAKYVKPEKTQQEEALERMKQLDSRTVKKSLTAGLGIGILGTLVFGTGMSLTMVWSMLPLGILISLAGLAGVFAAFPLYQRVLKKEREKVAPEILRLSEVNA